MLLRALVQHWLREAAAQKVVEAFRQQGAEATRRALSGDAPAEEGGEPPPPPPPCFAGVVCGSSLESGGLIDLVPDAQYARPLAYVEHAGDLDGRRLVIAESGAGAEHAHAATENLILVHKPAWVISAGFATALADELTLGRMLLADEVADGRGRSLATGLKLDAAAQPGLSVGRLLTLDRLVRDPAERRRLGSEHAAAAADMESFAVAEVCRREGVRFLAVRIVTDPLDEDFPPEIEHLVRQTTLARRVGAALGALWSRPGSVKEMWALRERALKASDRLGRFVRGLVANLPA